MDKDIEERIIEAFIIERKKERARYELFNDKKRGRFLFHIEASSYIEVPAFYHVFMEAWPFWKESILVLV